MDLLDHDILNSKDRRRQAPQWSSRNGAHLTLLDLSSRSSCPFHGKGDAARRSSPPAVKLESSTGHRRPTTSFHYNLYSSRNPSGNMANPSRGECTTKTPSSSRRYGWAEPGEGWTRCSSSRSRSCSKPLHISGPARQCPGGPEIALEVKQRRGPLLEQQGLPRALAFQSSSTPDDCIDNNNETSGRSRAIMRLTEGPLEDISPERLQEPSRPRKRRETRAASGVHREQGYDATAQQDEVQACQETERTSRVQKYPVSSQRWHARLEEARNIKHVGSLRRRVENLLPSARSSSLSQSTRESTSGSRENFLAQVQGERGSTRTEKSRRGNEKSNTLQKGEECSEAASRRDSLEDAEEVTDANDDRGPSAMPTGRRLQETGACTDGAIHCASLEKAAATDIAVPDRKQTHSLKSTARPEEINTYVDATTTSSGAYIRSLATDTKGEEGFRGGKFEPLETMSATITEVEAEIGTNSHGSDPRQETTPRRVDVSSVVKPLNKCEISSSTSCDRKKTFDTRSRSSTSTRTSAHSDVGTDTRDRCGNLRSRRDNSCITEQVTRATQTPQPENQRTDSIWSLQTLDRRANSFVVDWDDIQAFSPRIEAPVTGKKANSAVEVIATPEPERSVHGGTQERHGDASNSPPIEDAPDKVNDQVKDLQRELYRTKRSLAAFKILFFFSRNYSSRDSPPLTMNDRALEVAVAFARWRHQNCVAAARKETPIRVPRSPYRATGLKKTGEQQPPLNISGNVVNTEGCPAEEAQQAARNIGIRRSTTPTPMPPMPPIPPSSRRYRSDSSVINNIPPQSVEDTQKARRVLHPTKQEEGAHDVEVYQSPESEGADHGKRCAAGASKIAHGQVIHQNREPIVSTINEKGGRYGGEAAGACDNYRFEVGLTKVDEASRRDDEHHLVIGVEGDEEHVGRQWGSGWQQQKDWRPEGGGTGEAEKEEDGEMGDEEINGDEWELENGTKAPEEEVRREGEGNEEQEGVETATGESHGEGNNIDDDDEAKQLLLYRRDCAILAGTAKIVLALAASEHRRIYSRFYQWKRVHRYADDERGGTSLRIEQVGPKERDVC